MKISLSRPLISYLTSEIEKGDITRALLWANEYREDDPCFVTALYTFAEKTGRLRTIKPEFQQELLTDYPTTDRNSTLSETGTSTRRKPRAPSRKTLELRFAEKSPPLKSAK